MTHRLSIPTLVAVLSAAALTACQPAEANGGDTGGDTGGTAPQAAAPAAAQATFTPEQLSALIAARGADGALSDLFDTYEDGRWQALLTGLSAGDQAWIDAGAGLKPALDGEASESFWGSVGEGLAHNASGALRLAGTDYHEAICWHATPESIPDAEAFNAARIAAVEAIDPDGDLAAIRDECLIWLSGEPT